MFSKLFSAALVLGLTLQVSAHAIINPALGVTGTARRNDVKRPSTASPCGNGVNVAQQLAASTAVTMNGNTFTTTVTNFNGGRDGSRQVTAQVDATGTGKNFVAATVTKNGDAAPQGTGSQQITVQMPAGTTCTGGNGKTCLVAFKTAGNFGNCIAVTQGGAATGNAAAAATGNTAATAATTTGTGRNGRNGRNRKNAAQAQQRDVDIRAIASRAARFYRELEELAAREIHEDDIFPDTDEDDFEARDVADEDIFPDTDEDDFE